MVIAPERPMQLFRTHAVPANTGSEPKKASKEATRVPLGRGLGRKGRQAVTDKELEGGRPALQELKGEKRPLSGVWHQGRAQHGHCP